MNKKQIIMSCIITNFILAKQSILPISVYMEKIMLAERDISISGNGMKSSGKRRQAETSV